MEPVSIQVRKKLDGLQQTGVFLDPLIKANEEALDGMQQEVIEVLLSLLCEVSGNKKGSFSACCLGF